MRRTDKEDLLIKMYRMLDPEQRTEVIKNMRALIEANRITQDKMSSPIKIVGNWRIEEKFGIPKPSAKKRGGWRRFFPRGKS